MLSVDTSHESARASRHSLEQRLRKAAPITIPSQEWHFLKNRDAFPLPWNQRVASWGDGQAGHLYLFTSSTSESDIWPRMGVTELKPLGETT